MPITKSKVSKILSLNLNEIPEEDRDDAKQEVIDFLKEQLLVDYSNRLSPVTGKTWKGLSADYKEFKSTISSDVTANMELNGDMLDSLEVRDRSGNEIEAGFFESSEAIKAFNHTTGDTVPKRPLIPRPKESFRKGIMSEIDSILEEFRDAGED